MNERKRAAKRAAVEAHNAAYERSKESATKPVTLRALVAAQSLIASAMPAWLFNRKAKP